MMEQLISYQLILNKSQADYLAASKYGINRMQALVSLLGLVKTADEEYTMKGSPPLLRPDSSSRPRWYFPTCGNATGRRFPGSWTR